eukprot:TRINITY_DN18201_c0_g1_i1.p1 TRINITY_DN18201_c0_g1~~TRINITY_DN18201_c0_g1_i1.p1  ORF type:complete len:180 (+),score=44.83 TRINITY_DN18201_c0_g1_i1:79-618(+)
MDRYTLTSASGGPDWQVVVDDKRGCAWILFDQPESVQLLLKGACKENVFARTREGVSRLFKDEDRGAEAADGEWIAPPERVEQKTKNTTFGPELSSLSILGGAFSLSWEDQGSGWNTLSIAPVAWAQKGVLLSISAGQDGAHFVCHFMAAFAGSVEWGRARDEMCLKEAGCDEEFGEFE